LYLVARFAKSGLNRAADGGDGKASVVLSNAERTALEAMAQRQQSDRAVDPTTGAELGSQKQ